MVLSKATATQLRSSFCWNHSREFTSPSAVYASTGDSTAPGSTL